MTVADSVRRVEEPASGRSELPPPSLGTLRSAGAERVRLHSQFLHTYLPQRSSMSRASCDPVTFLEVLGSQTSNRTPPALQASCDALDLVQVGSVLRDERLLTAAIACYRAALSHLAADIQRQDIRRNDDVLASAAVLATCELYEHIAQNNGGWIKHMDGASQLMRIRGPKTLDSDLALSLYVNIRNSALFQGLITRKASYMADPRWRAVSQRCSESLEPGTGSSSAFYGIVIQIPGLLERHDTLQVNASTQMGFIGDFLADAINLEQELTLWYTAWRRLSFANHLSSPDLRPVDEFTAFISCCPDRTCSQAYRFTDFHIGYLQCLYWICMYYLRSSVQSICRVRQKLDSEWQPGQSEVVYEAELLGYVMNICRCIPFFCEPVSGSLGHVAVFLPLRIGAIYFSSHGHWAWLKWLGSVRSTVFTKGLSPPLLGPRAILKSSGPT